MKNKMMFTLKIIFTMIATLSLYSSVFAKDGTENKYNTEHIIGVFAVISADSKSIDYMKIRDQICFELKDFPIIPYFETDIDFGLTNTKPKSFLTVLFGFKKNFIESHNLKFSLSIGSGVAIGILDKDNAGLIGSIGLDISYKNLVFRLSEINLISGFTFNGTAAFGLGYSF